MMLLPMAAAGIVGTFCVVAVNAWMNNPTGFTMRDGAVADVDPLAAMFNDLSWLQFLHMWVGAFMLVGLVVSGVYASGMLRGRTDRHHRLGFTVPFAFASVATLLQPLIGHVLGLQVGGMQPTKLAAWELNPVTEHGPAAEKLGGVLIDGHVRWALAIPKIGSWISTGSWDGSVPGLDTVPKSDLPPVNLTHWSFQLMVGIGSLLAVVVVLFWLARRRGYDLLGNRWFLRFSIIAGPLAILALELGWITTEVGRQPWTVWKVLRTADAVTRNSGIWWTYIGVVVLYIGMTIGAYVVLRSMARRWRANEEDLPSPYGPDVVGAASAEHQLESVR
jgi:cytochrome d ubiquinol oxidase subunit I